MSKGSSQTACARAVTQCDTERVGSVMNLVKTKKRTNLGHYTFAALVFLAFNLPWLHEMDTKLKAAQS